MLRLQTRTHTHRGRYRGSSRKFFSLHSRTFSLLSLSMRCEREAEGESTFEKNNSYRWKVCLLELQMKNANALNSDVERVNRYSSFFVATPPISRPLSLSPFAALSLALARSRRCAVISGTYSIGHFSPHRLNLRSTRRPSQRGIIKKVGGDGG